jgi:hypothetical protein
MTPITASGNYLGPAAGASMGHMPPRYQKAGD